MIPEQQRDLAALDQHIAHLRTMPSVGAQIRAIDAAEHAALSPLATYALVPDALRAARARMREADWIMEKHAGAVPGERLEVEFAAMKEAGLWPW